MSSSVRLPYLFERYGQHNMVRLIDPVRLNMQQSFFTRAVTEVNQRDKARAETMMAFDKWLDEQPEPDSDYSDFTGIFHVSRCGSTLLSRNIRETGRALVLSEPPLFRILRHQMDDTVSRETALRACLAMVAAWRRWAQQNSVRLVIKFNSQMHMYLDELFANMPGARFVFLHREPMAVFESLDRAPPAFLRRESALQRFPVPAYLQGMDASPIQLATAARYCGTLDRFAEVRREDVITVGYPDLGEGFDDILRHIGIDPAGATPWSATHNAKAKKADDVSPYVPVSAERLEQFAQDNAALLDVARSRYRAYLAAEAEAR